MSLESPATTAALHQCGKSSLASMALGSRYKMPQYRTAQSPSEEPCIPAPSVFDFDDATTGEATPEFHRLPNVGSCATHLQLLEVFYALRHKILSSSEFDASCGIKPERETKTGRDGETKTFKDPTLWDRRQVKWTIFIEFAAVRFLVWRRRLNQSPDTMLEERADGHLYLRNLPPLDVLMVWHSFMLNPRMLAEHCRDEPLYRLRMPWKAVHAAIRSRDWTFHQSETDAKSFLTETKLPEDLFKQCAEWTTLVAPSSHLLSDFRLSGAQTAIGSLEAGIQSKLVVFNDHVLNYKEAFNTVDRALATQLSDAVVRQTSFVDKMNAHLWIRSPAVEGTIRRATKRYRHFLTLLKLYPRQVIVPTLDIDLVWHTHQCTSIGYAKATKALAGRFINHDDTIGESDLSTSYDASKTYYRVHFGTEYRICGCWDCEALLSAVEDSLGTGDDGFDMAAIAQRALHRVTYHRAVELAIRNREPLPLLD